MKTVNAVYFSNILLLVGQVSLKTLQTKPRRPWCVFKLRS